MPHLSTEEILDLIYNQWKFKLTEEERESYKKLAKEAELSYLQQVE